MSDQTQRILATRRYKGEDIDITYSVTRCIHAEVCVHNLSRVFDKNRRPWIDAQGAAANEVQHVVSACPSGALHYERADGSSAEIPATQNTVRLWQDGPLQFSGDLDIAGSIELRDETRATLCRCGQSQHKPFCDNTHLEHGFQAEDHAEPQITTISAQGGKLTITPQMNGSLRVEGNLQIFNAAGDLIYTGDKTFLCRCGNSQTKPFCDGTHKRIGFEAD